MAEEAENPKISEEEKPEEKAPEASADMELEGEAVEENGTRKRGRGEGEDEEEKEENGGCADKKQKVEKSAEEERLEKKGEAMELDGEKESGEGETKGTQPAKLGPKEFASSVEMFDYFMKLLHSWAPNLDVNKYEHLVLQDLLKKGHPEHEKKMGAGIQAFQVRYHPLWKSRCYFILRTDGSTEDFSFRKCVDHILPLPGDMKVSDKNKGGRNSGQHKGGGYGGRGGGRGGKGGRGKRGRF